MNKQVLISNFHPNATMALVKDFKAIGFRVVMPIDDWQGRNHYFFDNEGFGCELLAYNEYMKLEKGFVLIGCYEQESDFLQIAKDHSDEVILHTAGNDVPYQLGAKYLLGSDIQTFNKYQCENKILYFPPPVVEVKQKDVKTCFESGDTCSYIHYYQKYWKESYREAMSFESMVGKVYLYGFEGRDGELDAVGVRDRMLESKFTLYFKEKDCYGNTVLESMALGTPVIAMRRFIHDKTLGMFFIDDTNSIIVDSVIEVSQRIRHMTLEEYNTLSINSQKKIEEMTNDQDRYNKMLELLHVS